MDLELISFSLCPYVQRSVILLKCKRADFQITHIDLKNKPAWFLEISPLGKVPVLRVNRETSVFESAVINEYLDETVSPRLMPEDPLQRAIERGWIEFSSDLFMRSYKMSLERDHLVLEKMMEDFFSALAKMEPVLKADPFFRGSQFSLVDAAWAPLWTRLLISKKFMSHPKWVALPKMQRWARSLMEMPEVRESVSKDFESQYIGFCQQQGSLLY
jgi:glutathione S-transferase